jgi:hypothetical protein
MVWDAMFWDGMVWGRDETGGAAYNHEGVDDGEPVDLLVGGIEVDVPSRRPLDVGIFPSHVIPATSSGRDGQSLG